MQIRLGGIAHLVLLACSRGSNDMLTWTYFADLLERVGFWKTYRIEQLFNHPPLVGLMAQLLRNVSDLTGLLFRVSFKLPMLAADLLCMAVLWRC